MALVSTTLSSAATATDDTIVVASATSFAAGLWLICNGEIMQISHAYTSGTTVNVLRGREGTVAVAHVASAQINLYALASDIPNPAPGTGVLSPLAGLAVYRTSISAAGAWTPQAGNQDERIILNGTSAIALTIVSPGKDQDGKIVTVAGNGKAAHTITYTTTGFGAIGTSADVLTFHATMSQACQFMACGGYWVLIGQVAGAASVAGVGLG